MGKRRGFIFKNVSKNNTKSISVLVGVILVWSKSLPKDSRYWPSEKPLFINKEQRLIS